MRGRQGRTQSGGCRHEQTVTIKAAGIERIVCEKCGHVSFNFVANMTDGIDRDQFARDQDSLDVGA